MEQEDGILCSYNEFLEHLKKHMKDLHADVPLNDRLYSEEDYPKLKALLVESASLMERNISKLHLVFSGMTVAALISLLKDTETVFINVVESARLFMCCGLSDAAKNEVTFGIDTIHSSIENLIDHCKLSYKEKRSKLSPSMTGAVWDACKRLSSISESNKKASMKETMRMVYVIRDIVKECRANLEDEDEDDWDGLLDDIQAFAGGDDACEVEEEAERTEEVKAEITNQIESLQRVFESLFRLFTVVPDSIPIASIPVVNALSAAEKELVEDANQLGMMIYTSESTDKATIQKTKEDMKSLVQVVKQFVPACADVTAFGALTDSYQCALDSLASHLYFVYLKYLKNILTNVIEHNKSIIKLVYLIRI